jgi:hypothetical protein
LVVNEAIAPAIGHPRIETFSTERLIWGEVRAIPFSDFYREDEVAFLAVRTLIVGDALCGGRDDLGLADGEVGTFDVAKISNREHARRSARRLLTVEFDFVCFGHGAPVIANGRAAVERFVDRDDVWVA